MPDGRGGSVLSQVHDLFDRGTVTGMDEGLLLDRFVSRRDEAAFEMLVARFGPMVLGVCRRRLVDPNDAEDAFQATFLILVRKAKTIRDRDRLGNWIYGVASRVSTRAHARARRRHSREVTGVEAVALAPRGPSAVESQELGAALDEELGRLPEKYRAPLVLCHLQGQTYEEAARRLKCPIGTIRSRTARARELLRSRLVRRGIALPAGLLAAALAPGSAQAAIPPGLSRATVGAAARVAAGTGLTAGVVPASVGALTREVLRAMFFTKLRWAALTVAAAVALATGAGVIAGSRPGHKPREQANPPGPDDHASIVDLERRLRETERKLEAVERLAHEQARTIENLTAPKAATRPDNLRKVRPRFECLVEKVGVRVGQPVKEGDALAELFSSELAAAKNAFLVRSLALDRDQKILDMRQKLYQSASISQQAWLETQSARDKSLLEQGEARDRLMLFGISQSAIDSLKEETGEAKARFTLRSPVDGTVLEIPVASQDFADPKTVLLVIGPSKH